MAKYAIFISGRPGDSMFFKPSEVKSDWRDTESSLDMAIKAQRFYARMYGFGTKREPLA